MPLNPAGRLGHLVGGEARARRHVGIFLVAATLTAALASCGSDESDPIPQTSSSAPTTPPPATTTASVWEGKYNAKELDAYRAALARVGAFELASKPIYATGKASPEAKQVLDEYFLTYRYLWGSLQYLEEQGYKTEGTVKVISSEATRIKLNGDEGSVSIRQCVDATDTVITQNGKVVEPGYSPVHIREIVLDTPANGGKYLISKYENKETPCDG